MSLPRGSYFIAIAPLAVYVVVDVVFYRIKLGNPYIGGLTLNEYSVFTVYSEARSRYLLMASVLISLGVAFVAVFVFFNDLFSRKNSNYFFYEIGTRIQAFFIFILIIVLAYCYSETSTERLYTYLGADIFKFLFKVCDEMGQNASCTFGRLHDGLPKGFDWALAAAVISTMVGTAAAVVGCVLSLSSEQEHANKDNLSGRFKIVRTYLYLSSALFATGILTLIVWMRMPGVAIETKQLPAYISLTNALGIYFGVAYTLIVMSFIVPINMILHGFAKSNRAETSIKVGRQRLLESIESAIAILAPLIVATITSVLGVPDFN